MYQAQSVPDEDFAPPLHTYSRFTFNSCRTILDNKWLLLLSTTSSTASRIGDRAMTLLLSSSAAKTASDESRSTS